MAHKAWTNNLTAYAEAKGLKPWEIELPQNYYDELQTALLGQRTSFTAVDSPNDEADQGFVSLEQIREFQDRPWKWERLISCDGAEVIDWDTHVELDGERLQLIRDASFSMAFWRLPRTKHYQAYDTQQMRNAYCKAGQYRVNIVTVMDDEDSCAFARAHYDMGGRVYPKPEDQHLGDGIFVCNSAPVSDFAIKLHPGCGVRNSVEVSRMENLWFANDLARRYDGVDLSYNYYVDPEDFELSVLKSRVFDPRLDAKFNDKFRVQCYKDGSVARENNCDDGAMVSPRRVVSTRVFGGSKEAVYAINFHVMFYFSNFAPYGTRLQQWTLNKDKIPVKKDPKTGEVTDRLGCLCPSDEEVLTQMIHYQAFLRAFAFLEKDEESPIANEYSSCSWVQWQNGRNLVD
jgi:hypothetical protein